MYEVEQKDMFKLTLTETTGLKQFSIIEKQVPKFEEEYQKGLSEFYPAQLVAFVDSLGYVRPAVVKQYLSVLKKYFTFCNKQPYDHITIQDINLADAIKKSLYPSFSALLDPIEKIISDVDGGLALPALVFAWLGIKTQQACELKVDDVNLQKKYILLNGNPSHKIKITDQAVLKTLRSYRNVNTVYREHYGEGSVAYKPVESEYFLRQLASSSTQRKKAQYSPNSLLTALTRAQAKLKKNGLSYNLTYKDVMLSGELEKAYALEKSGVNYEMNKHLLQECFSSSYPDADAMKLYQEYKKAFNLH